MKYVEYTLWFSKKAKAVLKTTVNLSSQNSEEERFASTPLSRSVVKMFVGMSETIDRLLPAAFKKAIAKRFKPAIKMYGNGTDTITS